MEPTILKVNDTFESLEALESAANLSAKANGFAFSRKDSNLTGRGGKSPFVILQCTKGGEWRNNWNIEEKTRKRKKKTKRVGCPVYIRAVAIKRHLTTDVTKDEIVWNVTKVALVHNHPLLELDEVATLPQHRTKNLSQKRLIQQLHDSNAPTRVITTAANKIVDGGIIHPKDIVNERARIRFALNEGPNDDFTRKLLRLFEERNYVVIPSKTAKGYLTHLFFFHTESAKCVAKCPEVLIVDSTYKTNIYKYPLVSAIGINNISNEKGVLASYQIAMAWIEDESEASYIWFLQTLRSNIYDAYNCLPEVFMSDRDQALRNAADIVFPRSNKMLCVWHLLEQNLKTNCHKLFENGNDYELFKKEVEALRFTSDEEKIYESLNAVKKAAEKARDYEKAISYIQTWMKDSEKWILAYTKRYCHMGISTTGRAESSHSAFKRAIEMATDLEGVFRQIDQTMRMQHLKASMRQGSNKAAIDPFILRNPKFSELIGYVSTWAIDKIKRMLQSMANEPNMHENAEACECLTKINYKLPCIHMIPTNGPIPLSIINRRWLLERPDIIELPRPSKSDAVDSEFYDIFVKAEEKFKQLPDNITKREFVTKLNQVTNMPLPEPIKPPQKAVPKGRYSGTKRGLLLSEHQENAAKKKKKLNKILKPNSENIQQQNSLIKQKLNDTYLSDNKLYEANIPKFMREHVSAYFDVTGDGNCGFRAIALSVKKSEECWPDVRKLIYDELCNRKSHYIQLFLEGEKEYNRTLFVTQWEAGPCNRDHWMFMPSFGYIIANAFQRPVHYFSRHISITFLPDNAPLNRNASIVFAYIHEKQHFIAMKLKPNVPVPPIASGWEDICSEQSKMWKNLFISRIAHFKKEDDERKYLQKENL